MTWGTNPSYDVIPCPWCGTDMVDNTERLPSIHMMLHCPKRTWWRRLKLWIGL
jgi:hypothetical protein